MEEEDRSSKSQISHMLNGVRMPVLPTLLVLIFKKEGICDSVVLAWS